MTYKAIAIDTGEILATGTYPECHRLINARHRHEPAKIIPLHQPYTPTTAEAELETLAKEWELAELKESGKSRKPHTPANEKIEWTAEKEEWLLGHAHIGLKNIPDLFKKQFGESVTVSALKNRAYKLNSERGLELFTQNKWTAEDDAYLIANHATSRHKQMAEHLGRTPGAVGTRVKRFIEMGLLQRKKNSGNFRGGANK